jgi:RNA polymerase sigma factor (sigma-70 family)
VEGLGIVEAIRAGDPSGLAAAYDQYGDQLYGYCWSLLKDRDSAADALHDTFLVASQRIEQLRDAERFRAWLYAIARNECMRQLRLRRRSVALEEASEVSDESVDLDAGPREQELRVLVRDAAAGLSPKDREVLELAMRHDLDPSELAATLQVSQSHARALLSRVREQLERALGAVLVARDRRNECPELAAILAGWEGQMTVLLRKRVNRHLETCALCAESRRRLVSAPSLLSLLVPLALPPLALRARVLRDAFDPNLVGYRAQLSNRAGRLDSEGFPKTGRLPGRLDPRRYVVGAAAAALALGAFIAGMGMAGLGPFHYGSFSAVISAASPSPLTSSSDVAHTGPPAASTASPPSGPNPTAVPSSVTSSRSTPTTRPTATTNATVSPPPPPFRLLSARLCFLNANRACAVAADQTCFMNAGGSWACPYRIVFTISPGTGGKISWTLNGAEWSGCSSLPNNMASGTVTVTGGSSTLSVTGTLFTVKNEDPNSATATAGPSTATAVATASTGGTVSSSAASYTGTNACII